MNQSISDPLVVSCAIPQGSILGPLLFSIYVNDLPLALPNSITHLYADDMAITVTADSIDILKKKLNAALDDVSKWFQSNKLSLNTKKSKVMCFGSHQWVSKLPDLNIVHNGTALEVVHEYKYLGVMLDSSLTFTNNTEYIHKKVIKCVGILSRARHMVDASTALYLYNDGLHHYNEYTLQKLQNASFRRILGVPSQTPSVCTHASLNMDTLKMCRFKHTCVMLHKIIYGSQLPQLKVIFKFVSELSQRSTRLSESNSIYISKCNLEMTKRSFIYRASVYWNSLPVHVREIADSNDFKTALDYYVEQVS